MRWIWLIAIWAGTWILMTLGPLNLLILFIMAFLVTNGVQSRSWRSIPALALSPLPVLFVAGALTWFTKRPEYHCVGLPQPEGVNLHPATRAYTNFSGCIVDGSEFLRDAPRNLGLGLMIKIFGWPRRVYHGVYPTVEEARRLTTAAAPVPLDTFAHGKIKLANGQEFDLGAEQVALMVSECRSGSRERWEQPGKSPNVQVRIAQIGEDCVLVRVRCVSERQFEEAEAIYLVDFQTSVSFARYILAGPVSRFPYFASGNPF